MTAQNPPAFRATHNVAAEVHRIMAARGISTQALAHAIGHSPNFISNLLKGEDGQDRLINIRLLQDIANASGRTLTIKIPPEKTADRKVAVKSRGAK